MCSDPRPDRLSRPTPRSRRVIWWPGWEPGAMSTSRSPSRVSRLTTVPRAAAVIGISMVQCRSSPRRTNTSWAFSRISTYRSPAGPPPGPICPWAVRFTRVPSAAPAGTCTDAARRARTRPSPEQSVHGSFRGVTRPRPAPVAPAVAGASGARIAQEGAVAAAVGAGGGGHDVAEDGAGDPLHAAPALTGGAGGRVGARAGAGTLAHLAQHGGVD